MFLQYELYCFIGGTFCAGYDLSSLATADEEVLKQEQADGIAPMVCLQMIKHAFFYNDKIKNKIMTTNI